MIPKKLMYPRNRFYQLRHVEYSSDYCGKPDVRARRIPIQFTLLQQKRFYGTKLSFHSRFILHPLRCSVLWSKQYTPIARWKSGRTFSSSEGEFVADSLNETPSSNAPPRAHFSSTTNPSDPGMSTNQVTTSGILELLNQTSEYPLGSFRSSEYIRARNYFFLLSMQRKPTSIFTSLQERVQNDKVNASSSSGDLVKVISFANKSEADTNETFAVTDSTNLSMAPPADNNFKLNILEQATHDRIAIGLRLYERLLRELRLAFTPPAGAVDASDATETNASTAVEEKSLVDTPDMVNLSIEWGDVKDDVVLPSDETPKNDTSTHPTISAAKVAAKWILDPYQTLHPLLSEWKGDFLQRQQPKKVRRVPAITRQVLPASIVVSTLQRCYEIYRPVQCWNDPKTVKIILDMIILQTTDRAAAAIEADRFVSYVQQQQHFLYEKIQSHEAPKPRVLHKYPTMDMYRQLLHVWVNSGETTKALQRVPGLMKDLHKRLEVRPPIVFYNAMLKLHARTETTDYGKPSEAGSVYGRENRNKVDTILQSIANEESLQPTLETWFRAVQCYSKWHCFYEAQDIVLKQIIPIVNTAPVEVTLEFEDKKEDEYNHGKHNATISSSELLDRACEHIVLGYRRLLHLPIKRNIMNQDERDYLLNQATLFVQQMQRTRLLSSKALGIYFGCM
jgi:hypothetical protein